MSKLKKMIIDPSTSPIVQVSYGISVVVIGYLYDNTDGYSFLGLLIKSIGMGSMTFMFLVFPLLLLMKIIGESRFDKGRWLGWFPFIGGAYGYYYISPI